MDSVHQRQTAASNMYLGLHHLIVHSLSHEPQKVDYLPGVVHCLQLSMEVGNLDSMAVEHSQQ